MKNLSTYASLKQSALNESEEVKTLGEKTLLKRRVSAMLAGMRIKNEKSQKEIADYANWDKGFVSRLEGVQGGVPDLDTLARFADACGLTLGIVVCETPSENYSDVRVIDALSLSSHAQETNLYAGLINQNLSLKSK